MLKIDATSLKLILGSKSMISEQKLAASRSKELYAMQSFEDALTPEEWCKKLRKTGAAISARALRTKAREHGQFYSLGRAMLLSSAHVESLLRIDAADGQRQGPGR